MVRLCIVIYLSLLVWDLPAIASDSISTTNPAVSSRVAVSGAACSTVYERAITAAGAPLSCYGGTWNIVGAKNKSRISEIYIRTAADNNTTKVLIAYCPAGKRVIGGDCNFDGGTNMHKNVLGHSDGNTGYWCFFSFLNAFDPAMPGLGVITTADCIDQ